MSEVRRTDPVSLRAKLADSKAVQIIDTRKPEDFRQGHVAGAVSGADTAALQALDRSVETVVYCYVGVSSLQTTADLAGAGFTAVSSMDGGFAAWEELFGKDPAVTTRPEAPAD